MDDLKHKLIGIIKEMAEVFLLDAAEFYPFGVLIRPTGEVVPLGAYAEDENDRPSPQAVLELLQKGLASVSDYSIGAIALDILLTKAGKKYDVMEVRLFQYGVQAEVLRYSYIINKDGVDFSAF